MQLSSAANATPVCVVICSLGICVHPLVIPAQYELPTCPRNSTLYSRFLYRSAKQYDPVNEQHTAQPLEKILRLILDTTCLKGKQLVDLESLVLQHIIHWPVIDLLIMSGMVQFCWHRLQVFVKHISSRRGIHLRVATQKFSELS